MSKSEAPTNHPLLSDLGEFRLLEEVVFPLARRHDPNFLLGDDCAHLRTGGVHLAVSADVGPRPLVQQVPGHEFDLEAAGWHAAVATASDIATAGAEPFFMTNCIDAPPTLEVSSLEQFLGGYFAACKEFGFANGGGDIRQGPALAARVFGVGLVRHGTSIGRDKIQSGDKLVLIGKAGSFISAYIRAIAQAARNGPAESIDEILRFPRPQLREMIELASQRLIVAASDSSDGVLGAIENLARRSTCGFDLHLNKAMLPNELEQLSQAHGYSPWNLYFFWGDWSIAAVVKQSDMDRFVLTANKSNICWAMLGEATNAHLTIEAKVDGRPAKARIIRNENFTKRGFNTAVKDHVSYMLSTPIFTTAEAR